MITTAFIVGLIMGATIGVCVVLGIVALNSDRRRSHGR